jgi:hypothetical protein
MYQIVKQNYQSIEWIAKMCEYLALKINNLK